MMVSAAARTCISYNRLTPVVVSSDTPSIALDISVHLVGLFGRPYSMSPERVSPRYEAVCQIGLMLCCASLCPRSLHHSTVYWVDLDNAAGRTPWMQDLCC